MVAEFTAPAAEELAAAYGPARAEVLTQEGGCWGGETGDGLTAALRFHARIRGGGGGAY